MRGPGVVVAMVVLLASSVDWGQQRGAVPVQSQAAARVATQAETQSQPVTSAPAEPVKEPTRTSKQKLLDDQAQQLVTMANELKEAVDKTNKNILSLDVVRKAEEIESLARKMKDQGKK